MNIQDRIRQLQSNVVKKRADDQRLSDAKSEQAAAMSEDQFREAFKRQYRARDAKLMANAAPVVTPGVNSAGVRPPAQQAARPEQQEDLATRAQKLLESFGPPPAAPRPQQGPALPPKVQGRNYPAGRIDAAVRQSTDAAIGLGAGWGVEHGSSDPSQMHRYLSEGSPSLDRTPTPRETGLSNKDYTGSDAFRRALAMRNASRAAAKGADNQPPRDTNAERIGQLTESGLNPDEASRVAGFERSVHGGVSPQLSDANNTPEAKAERARRVEGMRRTEARQDNYARGQLDGHLTGREAFEARAQQEGLRGTPDAKPQGWQPISLQDFTDRAAGYGLTPEAAAQAYEERPDVMRDTGNSRVMQAQASRAQAEWLKTMPGIHRKHAQEDAAKYGYGTPEDQITPEQYNARIERRNKERAALDPAYARERQIAKLAKASGKTPEEVEADMFPKGVPQPSEEFKERQAARKAQHARANEKIWERKGYRGHLHEKTLSGDPATVREGLNRLHTITGDPAYLERIKALDAADAETAAHTRGMEKLTAEQQQALMMQNDAQAADENMELLRQKGAKGARDDQSVDLDKDRKQALTLQERTDLHELEKMRLAGTLEGENARRHAQLKMKVDAHAAGLAEAAAAAQQPRDIEKIEATGRAEEGVEGVRVAAGTPQSTANGYADEAFANPALSMGNSRNEMAAQLRSTHPHLTEDQALELATSTLRRRSLMNAAGGSMHPGVRAHLTNEMKRLGDDGRPALDASGKPSQPMTQEEFRAYAIQHAGMDADAADRVYNDLNGVRPSAGQADLPPVPPGRIGPPRPTGERRSGGAWSQPTPAEVEKARADRKKAAEDAAKGQRRHPYSRD
jgi:hypothetical protein